MKQRNLLALLTALTLTACGSAPGTPKFGRWEITELTGEIKMVDSGAACSGSWTFKPNVGTGWDGVSVRWGGEMEFFLSFHGVADSPHPDGYDLAGPATGQDGVITGRLVREDLGSTSSADGTYDSDVMTVAWSMEQHVGEASGCKTDVTASGTFKAVPAN